MSAPVIDLSWRQPTPEGLTWRMAVLADLPAIHMLWAGLEARLGPQDRPNLFADPVFLTLVAEDEHGALVDAVYGEVTVEWTMIGGTRRGARTIAELMDPLSALLASRSVRYTRILVPMPLRRIMARMLPGMTDITTKCAHFVRRTR